MSDQPSLYYGTRVMVIDKNNFYFGACGVVTDYIRGRTRLFGEDKPNTYSVTLVDGTELINYCASELQPL